MANVSSSLVDYGVNSRMSNELNLVHLRSRYKIDPLSWFNSSSSMMYHTMFRMPYFQINNNFLNYKKHHYHKYYSGITHRTFGWYRHMINGGYIKWSWFRDYNYATYGNVYHESFHHWPNFVDYNTIKDQTPSLSTTLNENLNNAPSFRNSYSETWYRDVSDISYLADYNIHPWEAYKSTSYYYLEYAIKGDDQIKYIQDGLGLMLPKLEKEKYKTKEELRNNDLGLKWTINMLDGAEIKSQSEEKIKTYEKLTHQYNSAYLPMFAGLKSNSFYGKTSNGTKTVYTYLEQWCVELELAWWGNGNDITLNTNYNQSSQPLRVGTSEDTRSSMGFFSGLESNIMALKETSNSWTYDNRIRGDSKIYYSIKFYHKPHDNYRNYTMMLADTNRYIKYMGEGIHYTHQTQHNLITTPSTTSKSQAIPNQYRGHLPINRRSKTYEWLPKNAPATDHEKVWSDVANDAFPIRKDWYDVPNNTIKESISQLAGQTYGGYGVYHHTFYGRENDYTFPNYHYLKLGADTSIFAQDPRYRVEDDGSRNDKYYLLDRRGYLYHYFMDDKPKHHINHRTMDLGPNIDLTEYGITRTIQACKTWFNYNSLKMDSNWFNGAIGTLHNYGMAYTKWNGAIDLLSFSIHNFNSLMTRMKIFGDNISDYNSNPSAPAVRDERDLNGIPLNMFGVFSGDIAEFTGTGNLTSRTLTFTDKAAASPNDVIPDCYRKGQSVEVLDTPYMFTKGPNELFKYDFEKLAFDQTDTLKPYLSNNDQAAVSTFVNNLKNLTYPDGNRFNAFELGNKRSILYPFNAIPFFTPNILDTNDYVNKAIGINNTGLFGGYLNNPIQEFNSPINNGLEYRLGFNRGYNAGMGISLLAEKGGVDGPYGIGESDLTTYTDGYSGWGNGAPYLVQRQKIAFMPVLTTLGHLAEYNALVCKHRTHNGYASSDIHTVRFSKKNTSDSELIVKQASEFYTKDLNYTLPTERPIENGEAVVLRVSQASTFHYNTSGLYTYSKPSKISLLEFQGLTTDDKHKYLTTNHYLSSSYRVSEYENFTPTLSSSSNDITFLNATTSHIDYIVNNKFSDTFSGTTYASDMSEKYLACSSSNDVTLSVTNVSGNNYKNTDSIDIGAHGDKYKENFYGTRRHIINYKFKSDAIFDVNSVTKPGISRGIPTFTLKMDVQQDYNRQVIEHFTNPIPLYGTGHLRHDFPNTSTDKRTYRKEVLLNAFESYVSIKSNNLPQSSSPTITSMR